MARKSKKTESSSRKSAKRSRGSGKTVRFLAWGLVVCVLAASAVAVTLGTRSLLFSRNRHFTLRQIEVRDDGSGGRKHVDALLSDLGVVEGESNLFDVPVQEIRMRVEDDVVVEWAEVTRRLPGQLRIRIVRREAVAVIKSHPKLLIDAKGFLMPLRQDSSTAFLPEITGAKIDHAMRPGVCIADEVVTGALAFLELVDTRPDGHYYDVKMVQLSYSLPSLRVHLRPKGTFRKGAVVVVPIRAMKSAMDRMLRIVELRNREDLRTSWIDVTYERNVPTLE